MQQCHKRRREDDSHEDLSFQDRAGKRNKRAAEPQCASRPPHFSKPRTRVTRGALRELDSRLRHIDRGVRKSSRRSADFLAQPNSSDLARFATHGGPDLSDLRGYAEPDMSSSKSSRSQQAKSTLPSSVGGSAGKSRKSRSAYGRDFEQDLTDHGIRRTWDSKRPDLEEVRKALGKARASSPLPEQATFEEFCLANAQAKDEDDVLADVIPALTGLRSSNGLVGRNILFTNLAPLVEADIGHAKPDMYYGADPTGVLRRVRRDLRHHIVPSTAADKPIVPNFFVEYKGRHGTGAVAEGQARYDGAIGARAMNSLQSYELDKPVYDGRPYAFTSTYYSGTGTLQLYAHHPMPADESDSHEVLEYHMTQLKAFAMTNDLDTFAQGVTAFRNLRDLAKELRETFIRQANDKARQAELGVIADDGAAVHEAQPTSFQASDEEASDAEASGAEASGAEASGAEASGAEASDAEAPDTSHHQSIHDALEDFSHASSMVEHGDTATSFTSSFTSGFTAEGIKRPHTPPSPQQSRPSKSREQRRGRYG